MNLTDFFISAPLAALLSSVFVTALVLLADEACRRFLPHPSVILRALAFFTALSLLSTLLFFTAWLGYANGTNLRLLFWGIIALGVGAALRSRQYCRLNAWMAGFRTLSVTQRLLASTAVLVAMLFIIMALAPPTDADSLDYHLGMPLQVLKEGSLTFDANQLHYRLFGYGEMLNMLGIANGCVQLGAALQLAALFWLVAALIAVSSAADRLPAILLLMGLPVLLFLIPSQKHQVTGICCTAVCFYFIANRHEPLNLCTAALLAMSVAFAAALKYSFLISAAVLVLFLLAKRGKALFGKKNVLVASTLFLLVWLPLAYFKWQLLGDPLSPLLEGRMDHPNEVVLGFHKMLQQYADSNVTFPFSLVIPASAGALSTVLGVSAILLVSALVFIRSYVYEAAAVVLFLVLLSFGGQKTSRFFLEPFIWLLPFFLPQARRFLAARWLVAAGIVQFLLLIPFYGYAAFLLGRGILSDGQRHTLLSSSASGYEAAMWIDTTLPKDAVIATEVRSRCLLSQQHFPLEYMSFSNYGNARSMQLLDSMVYNQYKVQYIILSNDSTLRGFAARYAGDTLSKRLFLSATRNPFNRVSVPLTIYRVKPFDTAR